MAIPRIVPPPCSYSRRICSNSSTLALLSTRPPFGRLSPKRSTRYMSFSRVGPNQTIERGQFRVAKSWIVHALVREDGLSQVEVAELLGRHKSWVCRRLALIERLGPKARDELRVGLLSPTSARQIVRLPEGNQAEVLAAIRRESLSSAELGG